MTRAYWTTMQVAFSRATRTGCTARRRRNSVTARRQRFEDRIEMIDYLLLASDHLAVAALESPHTTARAGVNVMNTLCFQFLSTTNIVDVVGVTTVDDDVVRTHHRSEIVEGSVNERCRNHQPDRALRL